MIIFLDFIKNTSLIDLAPIGLFCWLLYGLFSLAPYWALFFFRLAPIGLFSVFFLAQATGGHLTLRIKH